MILYKNENMQIKAVRKEYNTYDIVVFVRKIFGKGFQEAETLYRNYTNQQIKELKTKIKLSF